MHILQIIHTMIQHIALALHPAQLLPHDAGGTHFRVAKGADLCAPHVGHLLQFYRFGLVVGRAAVAAKGEDGEVGAVAEAPALRVEDGYRVFSLFMDGMDARKRQGRDF